jgi:hypothetical protein
MSGDDKSSAKDVKAPVTLVVRWESVKVTVAVAAKGHLPRVEIFNGETQSIKFDRTMVVTGKLTNRKKVMN